MTLSGFPHKLDVFPDLLEGIHPDIPNDWRYVTSAVEQIERSLGKFPSGENTDVAARLDAFLDSDGLPKGMAFIFSTTSTNQMSVGAGTGGHWFPFGKTFTSTEYMVLVQTVANQRDEGEEWSTQTFDHAHITDKLTNQVKLGAYQRDGQTNLDIKQQVSIAILVIHEEVMV